MERLKRSKPRLKLTRPHHGTVKANPKSQRVRDPLHNLIEFGTEQIEDVIWRVIAGA